MTPLRLLLIAGTVCLGPSLARASEQGPSNRVLLISAVQKDKEVLESVVMRLHETACADLVGGKYSDVLRISIPTDLPDGLGQLPPDSRNKEYELLGKRIRLGLTARVSGCKKQQRLGSAIVDYDALVVTKTYLSERGANLSLQLVGTQAPPGKGTDVLREWTVEGLNLLETDALLGFARCVHRMIDRPDDAQAFQCSSKEGKVADVSARPVENPAPERATPATLPPERIIMIRQPPQFRPERPIVAYGLLGGATAALALGVVSHVQREQKARDFNGQPCGKLLPMQGGSNCESLRHQVDGAQKRLIIGYGAAAALTAAAAGYLFWSRPLQVACLPSAGGVSCVAGTRAPTP